MDVEKLQKAVASGEGIRRETGQENKGHVEASKQDGGLTQSILEFWRSVGLHSAIFGETTDSPQN